MPEQLWATTLNPATRTLRKLTVEDAGAWWGGTPLCAWRLAWPLCPARMAAPCSDPLRIPAVNSAAEASHMFALLMGDKVGPRRELIERHGSRLALEELDI